MACPTEPGLYLAKSRDDFKWWNLIVEIQGEPPFLYFRGWDRSGVSKDGTVFGGQDPKDYPIVFGPKIEEA